jgi:hypothetical protein
MWSGFSFAFAAIPMMHKLYIQCACPRICPENLRVAARKLDFSK